MGGGLPYSLITQKVEAGLLQVRKATQGYVVSSTKRREGGRKGRKKRRGRRGREEGMERRSGGRKRRGRN